MPYLKGAVRVISSPLLRACQTAETLGPPIIIDDRWIEVDYGIHDGLPIEEVQSDVFSPMRDDVRWAPEGGESLEQVAERVEEACEEIWLEAAQRDVVVVSHVSPIKAAVAWALGAERESVWRMFVEVASVSRIGAGPDGRPSLRSFNEIHHRPSD